MTRIMGTSHEDQYTLIVSRSNLPIMRKVSDKLVEKMEKKNHVH